MKEIRVPSDVIKAILHYMGAHKRFPANVPKIHNAFYELSQEKEFLGLFADFVYDTSGMFPYSPTIRYALDRLQKSNLLACINPGLDEFEISESLSKWELDASGLFNDDETKLLKKVAEKFGTLVST